MFMRLLHDTASGRLIGVSDIRNVCQTHATARHHKVHIPIGPLIAHLHITFVTMPGMEVTTKINLRNA